MSSSRGPDLESRRDAGPIPPAEVAKSAPREWNRAIAVLAAEQHGLVTVAQLEAMGFSSAAVRRRAAGGALHRIHRGVFAVRSPQLTHSGHRLAAVLACGEGTVLSHHAAAAHAGFRASDATVVDVISPTRAGRCRCGIRVHRTSLLPSEDVTVLDGVPLTTAARTIVDLAGVLRPGPLEYAIHRAQVRQLVTPVEIAQVMARFESRAGIAILRRILGGAIPGEERSKSRVERRFLRLCRDARLPLPTVNRWIPLPDGDGLEVDFSWAAQRLAVETDSDTFHGTLRAGQNDPRRDRLLTAAGWRVARFTARDVLERPDRTAAELHTLLRSGPISLAQVA